MKTKTILISINVLAEVPSGVVNDSNFNDLHRLENCLTKAVENVETSFKITWASTQTLPLNPESMNCGKCDSCGCWVSDREKDGVISQLDVAACVDGKLLCDECLPKNHPLAF